MDKQSGQYQLELYLDNELQETVMLQEDRIDLNQIFSFRVPYNVSLIVQPTTEGYKINENTDDVFFVNGEEVRFPYQLESEDAIQLTDDIKILYRQISRQSSVSKHPEPDEEHSISLDRDPFADTDIPVQAATTDFPASRKKIIPTTSSIDTDVAASQRLPCAFCFRTLDPQDEKEDMCTFIQHRNRYYHRGCWQQSGQTNKGEAKSVTIEPPPPLTVEQRIPVLLHSGPANSLQDKPLGISAGTISLDKSAIRSYQKITIRNNTNASRRIPRQIGPPWAYIDLGNYQSVSDTMTLKPDSEQTIYIYPHSASPHWKRFTLHLNARQTILLISDQMTPAFAAAILSFLVLLVIHVGVSWQWLWDSGRGLYTLINWFGVSVTSGLFVGWLVFMMPAHVLWQLFQMTGKFAQLPGLNQIAPVQQMSRAIQERLYEPFQTRQIHRAIQNPLDLLGIAAGAALLVILLSLPIWFLVGLLAYVAFLLPLGLSVFSLGYVGGVLWMAGYLLDMYNLNVQKRVRWLVQSLYRQVRNALD